jgi:hypothetical protein
MASKVSAGHGLKIKSRNIAATTIGAGRFIGRHIGRLTSVSVRKVPQARVHKSHATGNNAEPAALAV